jgi:hypothetical protein
MYYCYPLYSGRRDDEKKKLQKNDKKYVDPDEVTGGNKEAQKVVGVFVDLYNKSFTKQQFYCLLVGEYIGSKCYKKEHLKNVLYFVMSFH